MLNLPVLLCLDLYNLLLKCRHLLLHLVLELFNISLVLLYFIVGGASFEILADTGSVLIHL